MTEVSEWSDFGLLLEEAIDQTSTSPEKAVRLCFLTRRHNIDLYALRHGDLGLSVEMDARVSRVRRVRLHRYALVAGEVRLMQSALISDNLSSEFKLSASNLINALLSLGLQERLEMAGMSQNFFGRPIEICYEGTEHPGPATMCFPAGVYFFYGGLTPADVYAWRNAQAAARKARETLLSIDPVARWRGCHWLHINQIPRRIAQCYSHFRQPWIDANRDSSLDHFVLISPQGVPIRMLALPTRRTGASRRSKIGAGYIRYHCDEDSIDDVEALIDLLLSRDDTLEYEDVEQIAIGIVMSPHNARSEEEIDYSYTRPRSAPKARSGGTPPGSGRMLRLFRRNEDWSSKKWPGKKS